VDIDIGREALGGRVSRLQAHISLTETGSFTITNAGRRHFKVDGMQVSRRTDAQVLAGEAWSLQKHHKETFGTGRDSRVAMMGDLFDVRGHGCSFENQELGTLLMAVSCSGRNLLVSYRSAAVTDLILQHTGITVAIAVVQFDRHALLQLAAVQNGTEAGTKLQCCNHP
jgi:hypothetical protein